MPFQLSSAATSALYSRLYCQEYWTHPGLDQQQSHDDRGGLVPIFAASRFIDCFGAGTFKRWNPSRLLFLPARRMPWIKPIKPTNRLICTAISSLLLQVHTSMGSHVHSEMRPTHCCALSGLLQSQTVQNIAVVVEEDLTEDELLLGLLSCMDSV